MPIPTLLFVEFQLFFSIDDQSDVRFWMSLALLILNSYIPFWVREHNGWIGVDSLFDSGEDGFQREVGRYPVPFAGLSVAKLLFVHEKNNGILK